MNRMQSTVPLAALQGSLRDFLAPKGPDLVGRSKVFFDWQDVRRTHGL